MSHTHAIPSNPFCIKGRSARQPGPLCPWAIAEHSSEYLPIDKTEEAYLDFDRRLAELSAEEPIAVVVYSEDGCGKTSLIHRCVSRLQSQRLEVLRRKAAIIDRSSETVAGIVQIRKCEDTANGVIRFLSEVEGFLPSDVIKHLPDVPVNSDEVMLRKVLDDVARKLLKAGLEIIVIAPKVELADELFLYLSIFQRPGVTIFLETEDDEVFRAATRRKSQTARPLIPLAIGALNVEDGWTFVRARLGRRAAGSASPTFSKVGVDQYMTIRSVETGVSVGELESVCIALYDEAVRSERTEIKYEQFAEYYVRVASIGGAYAA